jgi:hypothetical protein
MQASALLDFSIVTLNYWQPATFVKVEQQPTGRKWEDVCKSQYNYFADTAKSSLSTCRGCARQLSRDELRLKGKMIRIFQN